MLGYMILVLFDTSLYLATEYVSSDKTVGREGEKKKRKPCTKAVSCISCVYFQLERSTGVHTCDVLEGIKAFN